MPKLIFVAGPNGSGKTTVAAQDKIRRLHQTPEESSSPIRINPDDILRELAAAQGFQTRAELEGLAAEAADTRLQEAIKSGASVLRETVLSTERLLPAVGAAKSAGYEFFLLFVLLRDPELNVARVAGRVRQGGHPVPEDKIRARWDRAMAMLPVYAALADNLLVYDNSAFADPSEPSSGPLLLIEVTPGSVFISPEAEAITGGRAGCPAALRDGLARVIEGLDC